MSVAELVSRADREDLMLFYNLPAFAAGDANAFLSGVARANGLIKKVRSTPSLFLPVLHADHDERTGRRPRPRHRLPPRPARLEHRQVPAVHPTFRSHVGRDRRGRGAR